jgi:hypothetical protein
MQTSRFQLGLIATLAVGLGFSLASSEAVGYPAGAAVSLGSNPVWSTGGDAVGEVSVIVAPEGQRVVVGDVVLSASGSGSWHSGTQFSTCISEVTASAGGETIAKFRLVSTGGVSNDNPIQPTVITHAFSNGLPVNEGDSLLLNHSGNCDVAYTLSGYYAQP